MQYAWPRRLVFLALTGLLGPPTAPAGAQSALESACREQGWREETVEAAGLARKALWKGPAGPWTKGAILVLHGGGGEAAHFCAGGRLVQPQVRFARMSVERGFAVFALEATDDLVTDARGRPCGKRFDFSVLDRPNRDLPYVEAVLGRLVPTRRPAGSRPAVFMAGLSTGGYMTIRAATRFDDRVAAFAPVSAGDPYGTDTDCDVRLSRRTSAKGILTDRETGKEIVEAGACRASGYPGESPWEGAGGGRKPAFKQFHHEKDGIVDLSCMRKASALLERHGYRNAGDFVVEDPGPRRLVHHLWRDDYNAPILDFFEAEGAKAGR